MKRLLLIAAIVSGVGCSHPTPPPPPPPPTPLAIVAEKLPTGFIGQPYLAQLHASGGVPPYTWKAMDLPPGMTLATSGLLGGTPIKGGSYSVTLNVEDSAKQQAMGVLTLKPQDATRSSTTESAEEPHDKLVI